MERKLLFLLILSALFGFQKIFAQEEIQPGNEVLVMEQVPETLVKLVIAVDNRKWEEVKACFSDTVLLDYTSMAGGKPAELTPDQIIASWKELLPGFDHTHHQLGNFVVSEAGSGTAKLYCYVTATHYLKNDSGNNVWTVVGSYDAGLVNDNNKWKITSLKFNLKYTDGNNDLPKMAKERLANK